MSTTLVYLIGWGVFAVLLILALVAGHYLAKR
jgi:hypothetical protein